MSEITIDLAREFVALTKEKRDFAKHLKVVKDSLKEVEERLILQLGNAGISKLTVDGMTVYTRRELWAFVKPEQREAAIAALRENDHGEFVQVTPSTQRLRGLVRDWEEEEVATPAWFAEVFNTVEKYKLGARAS